MAHHRGARACQIRGARPRCGSRSHPADSGPGCVNLNWPQGDGLIWPQGLARAGDSSRRLSTFDRMPGVTESRAVFVFARDGDMHVFPDKDEAAGWVEAVDVIEGEYEAVYCVDGAVLEFEVDAQRGSVSIGNTFVTDVDGLCQRIATFLTWSGRPGSADDPQAVADELIRWEREHRWPRWRGWLPRLRRPKSSGASEA